MSNQINNIQDLDARIALLEQKATDEKLLLKTCSQNIAASLKPGNMLKMAMQRSAVKDLPIQRIVTDGVLLAGDALGNKYFGPEKFTKIKSIAMPFFRIVKSKLIPS